MAADNQSSDGCVGMVAFASDCTIRKRDKRLASAIERVTSFGQETRGAFNANRNGINLAQDLCSERGQRANFAAIRDCQMKWLLRALSLLSFCWFAFSLVWIIDLTIEGWRQKVEFNKRSQPSTVDAQPLTVSGQPSTVNGPFIASVIKKKYHDVQCFYVKQMKNDERRAARSFLTESEARAAGFEPCSKCIHRGCEVK